MHQHIRIIISMIKGEPMCHFMYVVALSVLNQEGTRTPMDA
jgi:hypothetical protein